jgi:hypothetical protein
MPNNDGEHTCEVCGVTQLPLGWPTPTLCGACGRKRDMKEPKACPFCGLVATRGCQENDGSKFWIYCVVCDAQGPKADLQGLAVWEWNKRKSPNLKTGQSVASLPLRPSVKP